ncbi:MAG: sulfotransferase [Bacteroidia bacterium]|nr:sulfotransferase [Bacteroidia bacterium]
MQQTPTLLSMRLRPACCIIGERKCGTSSLFRYLCAHPQVLPGQVKEPQWFSKAPDWAEANIEAYWALFPEAEGDAEVVLEWPELDAHGQLYHSTVRKARQPGWPQITLDASANALHEADPALMRRYLPDARLVALLRDPAERAFSHHRMFLRFQAEGRPFAMQTADFETDVRNGLERIAAGGQDEFISPGCYLRNLRRWMQVYPPEQFLILFTRDLEQAPQQVMDRVHQFLGLAPWQYGSGLLHRFNRAPAAQMPPQARAMLESFYEPHDAALAAWLESPLPWRSPLSGSG